MENTTKKKVIKSNGPTVNELKEKISNAKWCITMDISQILKALIKSKNIEEDVKLEIIEALDQLEESLFYLD